MSTISIAILTLHLYMPDNQSLKQKRGMLKPVLARLHRDFNLSAAEVDHLDSWKESLIACAIVAMTPFTTNKSCKKQ